jgi:acyl carrier protein
MERTEIIEKIRKILVDVLKHEKFEMKDSLSASDVDGWDSLTHMIIITDIEKVFGIKIKLRELNKLNNMGDLLQLVASKTAGA